MNYVVNVSPAMIKLPPLDQLFGRFEDRIVAEEFAEAYARGIDRASPIVMVRRDVLLRRMTSKAWPEDFWSDDNRPTRLHERCLALGYSPNATSGALPWKD